MPEEEYRDYLKSIQKPFIEIDKIIDVLIAEADERDIDSKRRFENAFGTGRIRNIRK